MTLYMDIVDHAGHYTDGPYSKETEDEVKRADTYVNILMEGLRQRNLENCVNLLMVSDHGMCLDKDIYVYYIHLWL